MGVVGLFLTATTVWGSTWLAIKVGLQDLPPLWFAGIRMGFSANGPARMELKDNFGHTTIIVFTRPDGQKQSAYKGHPLYVFAGDAGAEETTGKGVAGRDTGTPEASRSCAGARRRFR